MPTGFSAELEGLVGDPVAQDGGGVDCEVLERGGDLLPLASHLPASFLQTPGRMQPNP